MRSLSVRCMSKSAGFGFLLALAFAAFAIFVMPNVGYTILFAPGAVLAPVIGPILELFARFLAFDGGPELGVGLLLIGSLLFWWFIFTAIAAVLTNDPVA